MIAYYRIPEKKGAISQKQHMRISDDSELKDAIYNKSIEKIKILSFKNANIKDETLKLLEQITFPLPIIQIDLSQNFGFITDNAVETLTTLPCLKNLKSLNLADNQITDDSMVLLAKAASMNHLEELILFGNTDITGAALVLLSESQFLKHIKKLDLHATSVCDVGMEKFILSENSQDLQELNLSMSWKMITSKTLYAMANSTFCKKLSVLLLQDCNISDQGVDILSQSQNASHLTHLNLNNRIKQKNNIITDKTLTSISLSKYMTSIKCLELRNTDISAKGLKALSVSLAAQSIETLRLSHCKQIDGEVLTYLQKIAGYQSLRKVYLNQCKIDREDLSSFQLKNSNMNIIF